jgi:hypothetical protein
MEIMAFIFAFGTDFWEQNLMTTKRHLTKYKTEKRAADNTGLAKVAVQWLNQALCFVSSSVLADSFVLRNPPERKAQNVNGQFSPTRKYV